MRKTSKVRNTKVNGCLIVGFFGIFAIVGLAAAYFLTWKPISRIVAAREWVETECVVVSSDVEAHQGSDSTTYRVDIHYTYEAEWQTYDGHRYDFSVGSSSGYDGKARVVESLPPGSEASCYYNPLKPSESVINREPGSYLWWGLFPLPFLAVGLGGLIASLFSLKSGGAHPGRGAGRQPTARPKPRGFHASSQSSGSGSRGTLVLETQASPTTKVIGTLVFAILWNGIVSLFVFGDFTSSFGESWFAVVPILFLTPFVLIGIGLIGLFFYMVLAWFNPRPSLTLANGHLTPGQTTTLSWQFNGSAGRLTKLTIELRGSEEVRYRRGTDTKTETHVFYSQRLVTAEHFSVIHRGQVEMNIPEGTMPTFDANNNDIKWSLVISGDIPRWPDVDENFPITVYPG